MNANRLLLAVLAITAACSCRKDDTGQNKPDYVAMPTQLNFSACPTKDEMGGNVSDVFPDERKVTIDNLGKAPGSFTATLSGTDAAQFKLDAMRTPENISAGGKAELPVQFSPAKKGDSRATLTIDDGDMDTMPITVDLIGTGKNLPAQPTIEAAVENSAIPNDFTQVCKAGEPLFKCQQAFPDTLLGESSTLRIKLRNTGCPALKVTGILLEKGAGGADDPAFFLDQPGVLPSAQNPLVMSTADGTAEQTLVIRFAPQPESSGTEQRFGTLTITTNDPATPSLVLSLEGNGQQPSIYAVPTFCNFNNPMDPCRTTGAKVPGEAEFRITNGGGTAVTLTSALFKSSNSNAMGSNGRFTVMTPIDGTQLMPGASTNLIVKHNDQPLFVLDQLVVSAMPTSAGRITLSVAGGTEPCMTTTPDQTLNYNAPANELTVQKVTVKAEAMRPGTMQPCGDLIIDGVDVTGTQFSIVDPKIAPGTRIAAGQQADISVQYRKPITGGQQVGELIIRSNDPTYGAPAHKKVLLQSDSPLNEIPVCVLKGCLPAMTNCSTMGSSNSMLVSLANTFPGTGPKNITLWGGDSYDPPMAAGMGIAEFKFNAIPPSPNVPGWRITGNNAFSSMNSQTLTLDPAATGQYRVFLYVKDASGQQSGMACQLNINVVQ